MHTLFMIGNSKITHILIQINRSQISLLAKGLISIELDMLHKSQQLLDKNIPNQREN